MALYLRGFNDTLKMKTCQVNISKANFEIMERQKKLLIKKRNFSLVLEALGNSETLISYFRSSLPTVSEGGPFSALLMVFHFASDFHLYEGLGGRQLPCTVSGLPAGPHRVVMTQVFQPICTQWIEWFVSQANLQDPGESGQNCRSHSGRHA